MEWLVVIGIIILFVFSYKFRMLLFNFDRVLFYAPLDLWNYFKHREFNNAPTGFLDIYTGLFGRGKTLSSVHELISMYNRFNNKKVWCNERKRFVTQKVHILSNIELCVPYVPLTSLQQVVETPSVIRGRDFADDTLTIIYVYIDEISKVLNSRSFRTNVNAQVLDSLLCCRHYHMGFIGTAQRFGHVDALFRQVTQRVIECDKWWRLQTCSVYSAYELENAANPLSVSPAARSGFFVRNKDYNAYNTLAVVGDLVKAWEQGELLSDKEILEMQGADLKVNIENEKKRKLFRKKKK